MSPCCLCLAHALRLSRRGPRLRQLLLALTVLAVLPAGGPAAAGRPPTPVQGTVGRVVDGDTLWFMPAGQAPVVVRLRDIDAPEICQPWGPEAKQALIDLALHRQATLRGMARDSHGRTLGSIAVDGVDVGALMVAEGHAWSARTRYDRGPLVKQERMAKALGRGLHATGGAVMPREFRQAQGGTCPQAPRLAASNRP
ncbi:MAG TPA: thermonuclease family protein [Rubrivivax sp.]|nr:thermonuclease family protein [Rubrivivax sp.]